MDGNSFRQLYEVVKRRQETFTEGSYTCYLFQEGLDKILKKCGEECSEVIIAAKSLEAAFAAEAVEGGLADPTGVGEARNDVENELCDLLYHVMVLMVELGIPLNRIEGILDERSMKIGNLKQMKQTDRLT